MWLVSYTPFDLHAMVQGRLQCAVLCALLSAVSAQLTNAPDAFPPFQFEVANSSISLGGGAWEGVLAEGTVTWPSITSTASFAVLPALVSEAEVAALRAALPAAFDTDVDSVDEMATFEVHAATAVEATALAAARS